MGNNSHAIGIAVFCKILPGEQMGKDEIQFIQRGTYKQITITRDFLSSVKAFNFCTEPVANASFTAKADSRRAAYSSLL